MEGKAKEPGLRALLLAAGYGTRLGRLGERLPKALLTVPGDGRRVGDHLLDSLSRVPGVEQVIVVTNRRFRAPLEQWLDVARSSFPAPLRLLCNGTRTPEQRLGAVGDLCFALDHLGDERDLFVLATDTIYDFELSRFVEAFRKRQEAEVLLPVVAEEPSSLHRRGVVVLGPDQRVVRFEEKPATAPSRDTVPPLYLLRAPVARMVPRYLEEKRDPDSLGLLVRWLVSRVRVEGWRAPGGRLDLGDPENVIPPA